MTETSLTTKSCMQCGFGNLAVAKFCSECGERFVVAKMPGTALESGRFSSARPVATAPQPVDPRAAFEQFVSSLATEDATSRLRSSIETCRAQLKTLGVPLPKATNPILVSLMESLKALPSNEISARIAIVTALGRTCDPAVLPPLLLVTGAQSRDVRKATAIALGCIRHPLSAYLLLPMLQDGSSRVKQAAFQALVQLIQPHTVDAILAACLASKSLCSLILETLRLVRDDKRHAFFQLLGKSNTDQQPDLKLAANWLRFEFRNAITESRSMHTAKTAVSATKPASSALPPNARPQEDKPERQTVAVAADTQSSDSSVFGWGKAEKSQSTQTNGAASAHPYSTRTSSAVAKPSQMPDRYEMTPDFAEDDDFESDVRLFDENTGSAADLNFFNSISESVTGNGYCDEDDDGSELEFASSGSQTQMSLSGMLAAPGIAGESSHQRTRPAEQSFDNSNRTSSLPGHPKHGSPVAVRPSFPFSAYDTATTMGNTPGLGMPVMPMMQPGAMYPAMMSAAPAPASAFDMTSSSPLIPAFTSSATHSVNFTATTNSAGGAGSDVSSKAHQSGTASGVTNIVLPDDDEQSTDEIEAAKVLARAAHEKALARLSAAREEAFRKLLEDAEEIPKTLPRLLKKRISTLMATPSTKVDRIIEQLLEIGATNSPAALSTLASFCHKPTKQVREACAQSIGGIAHPGSAVLLLKLLADKSGTVVEAALKSLTKLDLEPTRPVLLAAGLCGTSLRTVVTVGIESTSDEKKSEWETLLLDVLRADDTNAAAFAVSLLARIAGDTHLEIFQKLASHKAPVLRAAAVEALARTQAKRAISQINDALEDADPTVRAQAAMCVATMYSPRSVELLQKLVFDSNLTVRRNAAQSMSRIDESGLADVIARALNLETDATTVEYLLAALQRNGAEGSLPILQRYIEGESSQFREQAVKALRKLKIPASVPVFRRLLDDHTPGLRRQSVEQLAVLRSDGVLPRLREMLRQDPDETVRGACAKALGDFGDETSLHLLEEALEDHPLVRLQAVIALGRLGQTSAGPVLLALLRDQLPEIRYQAVKGVGILKLEDAVEHIEPLLEDSDEMVRRGAEQTLTDLGMKAGSRKARQWKRRISLAAGWITPKHLAGMIPGGTTSLLATILVIVGLVSAVSLTRLRSVVAGEDLYAGNVGDVALSGDGAVVAVLRRTAVLDLWSVKEGALNDRVAVPKGSSSVIIERKGGVLLFTDKELRKLDSANLREIQTAPLLTFAEAPADLSFNRATNTLYAFLRQGDAVKLKKIDCDTLKEVKEFSIAAKFSGRGIVNPDESMAIMIDQEGAMTICDLKTGQIGKASVARLVGQTVGTVHDMKFSSDMQFLALCTTGAGIIVLRTDGMQLVKNVPPGDAFKPVTLVFKDGSHDLTAVTPNGSILVMTSEFQSQSQTDISGAPACGLIDVAADGKTVALGQDEDKNVWLVSAEQKSLLHELKADGS